MVIMAETREVRCCSSRWLTCGDTTHEAEGEREKERDGGGGN